MWRRNETGTRRSQVRSNPRFGGAAPDTEVEQLRVMLRPRGARFGRRHPVACTHHPSGLRPSGIAEARPPPDAPSTRVLPPAGSRRWSLCRAGARPGTAKPDQFESTLRWGGARYREPPTARDARAEGCPVRQAILNRLHSPPLWPSPEWDRGGATST